MNQSICILCGQPMPPRNWFDRLFDWFLAPPPMHDPDKFPTCELLLRRRLGL